MKRNLLSGLATAAAIAGLWFAQGTVGERIDAAAVMAPRFEVDPFWPKPLPHDWLLGSVIGISVDSRDHVFITHRPQSLSENLEIAASTTPPRARCCQPAPNVLEFDPAGNLVNAWGGPGEGYDWPASNHGITVDHEDNVWIGGNGRNDAHILKFTRDGDFIAQFGKPGMAVDSNAITHFGRVAEVSIDPNRNIAYVADGYAHKRIAVLDVETGEFLRYWGAYGNPPSDEDMGRYDPSAEPAQQFRNPIHCAQPSNDGLVYVCDRVNDRIQVFTPEGEFVKEAFIAKDTLGAGSVWDLDFSKDDAQTYLYLVDGQNHRVYILLRDTLELITTFGAGGRQPGQFFGVHSVAVDSKGNLYTTETYEGKRLQKFVYRGLAPVPAGEQGTPWPAEAL